MTLMQQMTDIADTKMLVFIDSKVDHCQQLISEINPGAKVHILSPETDGVWQITQVLAQHPDIDSIHIISHGAPGILYIGNTELSSSNLRSYTESLNNWFKHAAKTASVVLYGCNVAAGKTGRQLIETLHQLTQATVRASKTLVGHASQGGNWNLDQYAGIGNAPLAVQPRIAESYPGTLSAFPDGDSFYRYVVNDPNVTFQSIVSTGTRIYRATEQNAPVGALKFDENHDGKVGLGLTFNFNYYGTLVSDITIGINGGIILGTNTGIISPINASLPIVNPQTGARIPAIFPYWADLDLSRGGDIYYRFVGANGNRSLIIEWNNVRHDDSNVTDGITFQLVLHESSNEITFIYNDVSFNNPNYDNGKDATIGLNGADQIEYSFNTPSLSGVQSIRFLADPRLVTNSFTIQEGQEITLTNQNLRATDFDTTVSNITYTITDIQNGQFKVNNVVVSGETVTFTQEDVNAGRVKFVHNGSENAPSFKISVNDPYVDPIPPSVAAQISFINVNDPPALTNVVPSLTVLENTVNAAPVLIDGDVTLSDPDSPILNGGQLTVSYSSGGSTEDQLSIRTAGAVSFNGSIVQFNGVTVGSVNQLTDGTNGKSLIVSFNGNATLAIVEAIIESLTYQNTSHTPNANRTLSIVVTDGAGGTSTPVFVPITVTAENDAPIVTIPGIQTIDEDSSFTFAGSNRISVEDVDAGNNWIQVVVTATNGRVTLGSTAGVSFLNGSSGTNSALITMQGTVNSLNTALNNMVFTPNSNFNGAASVKIDVDDRGNSGVGGALTDSKTVHFTVEAVNDAPVNTVPMAQQVDEDTDLIFSGANGISVSDLDVNEGTGQLQVTLSVTHGGLTLSSIPEALQLQVGTGTNDRTIRMVGTIAAINTALNGLKYRGDLHFNGSDVLTISTSDLGNHGKSGALTDVDIIPITVIAVNDPPVNTVPTTIQNINEDTDLIFSIANGNAISVNDVDVSEGNNRLRVTLSVNQGLLTLNGDLSALSFLNGDGREDRTMTFEGTIAAINAALNGLVYRGNLDYFGADTLSITTNDQGNTGKGPTGITTNTIAIAVAPVNDAPVLSGFRSVATFDEQIVKAGAVVIDDNVSFVDVDSPNFDGGFLRVVYSSGSLPEDQLSIRNQGTGAGQIGVNGSVISYGGTQIGTVSSDGRFGSSLEVLFNGNATVAAVQALIQNLAYQNTSHTPAPERTITITINDGDGGTSIPVSTLIVVNPFNDPPVLGNNTLTLEEGQRVQLNSNHLSATDVDNNDAELVFEVSNVQGGFFLINGIQGTVFTQQNIIDNKVEFQHDGGEAAPSYEVRVKDGTNTTVAAPAQIQFTNVNDAPVLSGFSSSVTFSEEVVKAGAVVLDDNVSLIDVDSPNFGGGFLRVVYSSGGSPEDQLSVRNQGGGAGQIGVNGNIVSHGGIQIGTIVSDGRSGSSLEISFNANATVGAVRSLIQNLAYQNNSSTPSLNRTITITINDGNGGTSIPVSTLIVVNPFNDPPVLGNNTLTLEEGQRVQLNSNHLSATDVDNNDAELVFEVSNVQGGFFLINGIQGTVFTQQNIIDNKVEFQHDGGEAAPSYEVRVKDGTNTTVAAPAQIQFTNVNDAPTLLGLSSLVTFGSSAINAQPAVIDNSVSFNDVDSPTLGGGHLRVTYSEGGGSEDQLSVQNTGNGTGQIGFNGTEVFFGGVQIGSVDTSRPGTNGMVFQINFNDQATIAAVKALIESLTYQNTSATPTEQRTIAVTVNDGQGGTSTPNNVVIAVVPENNPPAIAAPLSGEIDEDTPFTFSGSNRITIADADAGSSNLQITLTATHGRLTLSGTNGLNFLEGNGNGNTTLKFTGNLVNINQALDGLVFNPNLDFNGVATVRVHVDDLGNTGQGGSKTDEDIVSITVNAVNDAPKIQVSKNQTIDEDTNLVFAGQNQIIVSDVDSEGEIVRASLKVSHGRLSLNGDVTGLRFIAGSRTNSSEVVFEGTIADINAALEGLVYRGNLNFNGSDTLSIEVNDLGNTGKGGSLTARENVRIAVQAVNDPPVNIVPRTQTVKEEAALIFSTNTGNAVRVTDVDMKEGTGVLQVSLTVTNGTLTLAQTNGLTFSRGNGTSDLTMTFRGSIESINAALNGMSYRGKRDFFGRETLTIMTSDLGNTGKGGALLDVDTVVINVENVNDAPSISGAPANTIAQGNFYSFVPTAVDVDGDRLTFAINNKPAWASFDPKTGQLSGTPTEADIGIISNIVISVSDGQLTTRLSPFSLTVLDNKIRGTLEADQLTGDDTNDIIIGGTGNDTLYGLDGDDVLYGDDGDDLLFGENGNDTLYGGLSNDLLDGGNGDDLLYGEDGNDTLIGGTGRDTLYGGTGNDLLRGGRDSDRMYGDAGNDTLYGDEGNDLLYGGAGHDKLYGGVGNDRLIGGPGQDTLDGGTGRNQLTGGAGRDVFVLNRKGLALVRDFKVKQDRLAIAGLKGQKLFSKLGISQRGKHTIIEFDDRVVGRLIGVKADQITPKHFTSV
ncbi:DUF4347 domain-containing protein [Egbenema bharatensis]|uniref:DUF4347 domain-containing protein n=1 Tax=Egbenema bharatensis TaxID=3463334 RepID=UPI003A8AB2AD